MLKFKLKKRYEAFDIDLELALGEDITVLFGPSGAGKTQILKMVSGIVRPDRGEVEAAGVCLFDSERKIDVPIRERNIGYLFQDYALFPHLSVCGNIAYGMNKADGAGVRSRVAELMGLMRLTGLEERFPHQLSGGQKQRTALARTLATNPGVLLLDEPFSALDYQVREKLRTDLINIHERYPITTVLVTHDLEEAFMLGGRIAVINNGRVEQSGTREDVFYRPATRNVARFLGARNIFSGRVTQAGGDTITAASPEIGQIKAFAPPGLTLAPGGEVTLCIRPEEILVIRPGRAVEGSKVEDNIMEGEITGATGRGSTHILYMRVGEGETMLKIELPNFVLRKLELAIGKRIKVSLKKENIWVIPG